MSGNSLSIKPYILVQQGFKVTHVVVNCYSVNLHLYSHIHYKYVNLVTSDVLIMML